MEHLYTAYPDDREAALFYALQVIANAPPRDSSYAEQKKAGAILEKIFAELPNHPGVAHYIIHAYDNPMLANRALAAARSYAKIAPSSVHALHMPSHIFIQVGSWQEAIASNLASLAAARAWVARSRRKELAWLRKQSFVQPSRIAVAGNSFGGIETVLGVERGGYCAGIDSAGGAQSWAQAPELQSLITRAVRNAKAPIFFFQAANDFDLSPSKTLSAEMNEVSKTYKLKIYPPYGDSPRDGHSFGYFGSDVWAEDVFGFLNQHCRK
jgi:dienelactone hydrolase